MAYRVILYNNWDCNVDRDKRNRLSKYQIKELTKIVAKSKAIDSDDTGVMYEIEVANGR